MRITVYTTSSCPSCRAAKAAEAQGDEVAERVIRRLREALYVLGDPPDDRTPLAEALAGVPGLDLGRLLGDLDSPAVVEALQRDLHETRDPRPEVIDLDDPGPGAGRAKRDGDRWRYVFPTLVVHGPVGVRVVPGWKPLEAYVAAIEAVAPGATAQPRPLPDPATALTHWRTLTAPELDVLCDGSAPLPPGTVRIDLGGGPLWCTPAEAEVRGLA